MMPARQRELTLLLLRLVDDMRVPSALYDLLDEILIELGVEKEDENGR